MAKWFIRFDNLLQQLAKECNYYVFAIALEPARLADADDPLSYVWLLPEIADDKDSYIWVGDADEVNWRMYLCFRFIRYIAGMTSRRHALGVNTGEAYRLIYEFDDWLDQHFDAENTPTFAILCMNRENRKDYLFYPSLATLVYEYDKMHMLQELMINIYDGSGGTRLIKSKLNIHGAANN